MVRFAHGRRSRRAAQVERKIKGLLGKRPSPNSLGLCQRGVNNLALWLGSRVEGSGVHNSSLERTGDAAAKPRDNGNAGSWKAVRGSDPRPLSSQPFGCLVKVRSLARVDLVKRHSQDPMKMRVKGV